MTSLAQQLKALAVPHTQSLLAPERKKVSLLFDPNEAANLDKGTVFAIGKLPHYTSMIDLGKKKVLSYYVSLTFVFVKYLPSFLLQA